MEALQTIDLILQFGRWFITIIALMFVAGVLVDLLKLYKRI